MFFVHIDWDWISKHILKRLGYLKIMPHVDLMVHLLEVHEWKEEINKKRYNKLWNRKLKDIEYKWGRRGIEYISIIIPPILFTLLGFLVSS